MSFPTRDELVQTLTDSGQDIPEPLDDADIEVTQELLDTLIADYGMTFDDTSSDDDDNEPNFAPGEDGFVPMSKEQLEAHNKVMIGRGRRRSRKEAHAKATKQFAKEFGYTVDEARGILEAASNGTPPTQSKPSDPDAGNGNDDLADERRALAAERAAVKAERAEMKSQQVKARAIAALTAAGASAPERAVKMLELSEFTIESESDDFADAVAELAEDMPALFTTNSGRNGKGRSGVPGTGRQSPRNPQPQLTARERGTQRAKERTKARESARSPIERMGPTR